MKEERQQEEKQRRREGGRSTNKRVKVREMKQKAREET